MTIKTSDEIVIDLSQEIEQDWGPTSLQDPEDNRSDNLVRLVSNWGVSIADLYSAFEAHVQRNNIPALEGELLTSAGAIRSLYRKTDTRSKTTIMVTGEQGSILPAGTELIDRFGGKWETQNNIELIARGASCGYGQGVACAVEVGSFRLNPGELVFNDSSMTWIYSATNGLMLEIGGAQESDQAFRNRILNRGPLAHINGTSDAALNAIYAVDGVNLASYTQVQTCIGNGWMFVVHGGDDAQVGEAIKLHAGLGVTSLVGSTVYQDSSCTEIKFQRPCPVLLKLRVTLGCDCPIIDAETVKSLIVSLAPRIAGQDKLNAQEIARLSPSIDKVEIYKQCMPLYGCIDENTPTITDPTTGESIVWGTDVFTGLCGGQVLCAGVYTNTIKLQPWGMGVIDSNHIEVIAQCIDAEDKGCATC